MRDVVGKADKFTPADMAMDLLTIADRCKHDGHLVDSFVQVDAKAAGRIERTAQFLMLLDGHREAIRNMLAGKGRRFG